MADWFDDKRRSRLHGINALGNPETPRNWLDDLVNSSGSSNSNSPFGALSPPSLPVEKNSLAGLFASPPTPPASRLPIDTNALGGLLGLAPPSTFLGSLASVPQPTPPRLPVQPRPVPAPTKRKGFFSFHFDDLLRVNNVRNAWNINHPDRAVMRNFYDRSLWESTKLRNPEGLKNLIRRGMEHSSAVCVLVGTGTWSRRWVKYEIARSVVDGKGLLAIHINGLRHHKRQQPDAFGFNPLRLMGVYKSPDGKFFIYEKREVVANSYTGQTEWQWLEYADYTRPVRLPKYLAEPSVGYVMPLSTGAHEYDHVADVGHKNLGSWIDQAAIRAGR
jgi:hypothetical protein